MDKHISLSPCPFCEMDLTLDIDEEGGVAILHSLKGEKNCWFPSIVEIEMPVETTLEEMVEILNRRPIQESFEHALVGASLVAAARLQDKDFEIQDLKAELARKGEELKITDDLLKEAAVTIGAVIACCTYNSNDDAKIGIYGIDQNAFTRIDKFITHYRDAVSDGKVSVDVKPVERDLSDAEIEELGAQEAERKEFCPNCEAEVPCTHEAELYVCDICGEDFAKYIVSRNCSVSDVSMTQDVLTSIKTPSSIENTNPDYYNPDYQSPWISITSGRPPEKFQECIVLDKRRHVHNWIHDDALLPLFAQYTHWMPIPPLPEEERC